MPPVADDRPFLTEMHGASRRRATLEDTGVVAYLYLSAPESRAIVADAWVYNRVSAPSTAQLSSFRPGPPPAAEGYADADARLTQPTRCAWSFIWSADGESVAVCADGLPLAFIRAGDRRGFSRHLARSGPWGEPWSREIYAATFGVR
jgi:hypothetical protein